MNTSPAALCLREIDDLFRPFLHRKLPLCSRLVMSPLPRLYAQNGIPTPEMLVYYRRRAGHLLGLIITEPVAVNAPAAAADEGMARFYGGAALRAWKRICRAVHTTPCRIAPQLCHVGMLRPDGGDVPNPEDPAIGPSGIDPHTLEKRGETMSRERIAQVVQAFARAAADARLLGFDAVEICGGQGGLIDQFLRPETNQRHDEYGGDIVGRARFACAVLHAVRKAVGRQFPVIFRFSQTLPGLVEPRLVRTPAELRELLEPLCAAGVDIFACDPVGEEEGAVFPGSALGLAGWVRMLTGLPVITSGGVGLRRGRMLPLVQRLAAHEFDLVAVGRALLADAEWARKVHEARENEIMPFTQRAWARLF